MITWERMFIRMGFVVEKVGEKTFSFVHENDENISFFQKILQHLQLEDAVIGLTFEPREFEVNEEEFLHACEAIEGDHQTYFEGVANVELMALDTYISGLIRWLNSIGFTTKICCDGHDRRPAYIGFENRELETQLLNYCLKLLTNNEWGCSPRGYIDIRRTADNRRTKRANRYRLLDLAELIYENRTALKEFVQAGLILGGGNITDQHYQITQRVANVGERVQLKTKRMEPGVLYTFLTVKKSKQDHVSCSRREWKDI